MDGESRANWVGRVGLTGNTTNCTIQMCASLVLVGPTVRGTIRFFFSPLAVGHGQVNGVR